MTRDSSSSLKSLSGKNGCYQLANSEDGQTCPKNPINAVRFSLKSKRCSSNLVALGGGLLDRLLEDGAHCESRLGRSKSENLPCRLLKRGKS